MGVIGPQICRYDYLTTINLTAKELGSKYQEYSTPTGATVVIMPDGREITINRYRMFRDIDITIAHSSKIFTGKRLPSLEAAVRISQYIGITIEDLYWIIKHRATYLASLPVKDKEVLSDY